ncbi:MAG: thioredoxin-disulfide reductase [Acidimicrobiales bacterium]|nr:thioredoxin-disulfide reductase [Acidimicrobiales bacterium]
MPDAVGINDENINSTLNLNSNHRIVVIIGSGPAGLTSAIYTGRANLKPLLIEGEPSSTSDQPGGQLMLTSDIENFPGFKDGIDGPELMAQMRSQAERFGTEILTEKATKVDLDAPVKGIWTTNPQDGPPNFTADVVIISTGAQSLMLGIPGEDRLIGHGLSTCATCDGFFFRGKDIAVVGGGDSALEEALFLTRFANSVRLIHRRDQWRASPIMQDRARSNEKIIPVWNTQVTEIVGETSVKSLKLVDTVTGQESIQEIDGVFIAIGHSPNTDLFKGQLKMDDAGYLITGPGTTTNIEGVLACGDVQDQIYRQAITAAGSGCMAALDAQRWLEAHE